MRTATNTSAGTYSTTVTANATDHAKGSYAQLIASLGFDADALWVHVTGGSATKRFLYDLAVGAAASEQIIVANAPYTEGADTSTNTYLLPMTIPASTRLSARCQESGGGGTASMGLEVEVSQSQSRARKCRNSTTYGAVTGTTNGTQIDPGGAANTFGAYVQVTAATTLSHYGVVQIATNRANAALSQGSFLVQLAIGAAASEQILTTRGMKTIAAGSYGDALVHQFPDLKIPAGTRLAVRACSSTTDATDRLFDVVLMGLGT